MNRHAFRAAERRLWEAAGAVPTERRVYLAGDRIHVRVQEVGEGRPTLFLHGGPNAGSTWAFLAVRLPQLRCIVVDRPGTGLSDPPATRIAASSKRPIPGGMQVDRWLRERVPAGLPPPCGHHVDGSELELFELEPSACGATPWPKQGRDPARLAPQQIAELFA